MAGQIRTRLAHREFNIIGLPRLVGSLCTPIPNVRPHIQPGHWLVRYV